MVDCSFVLYNSIPLNTMVKNGKVKNRGGIHKRKEEGRRRNPSEPIEPALSEMGFNALVC
jgi:hypothetical protein